ncbi:MAG: type II secretion system protein GspM [Hyphomicrobium sp.]
MIDQLSKPVRQFVAIGLLVATILAVWSFVVAPVTASLTGLHSQIVAQREVLGRLLAAEGANQDAQSVAEKADALGMDRLAIKGDNDALRTAALQSTLTDLLAAQGVRIRSARAISARETSGVRLIGVQAQFVATLEQVQQFLLSVESAELLLFAQTLRLSNGPSTDAQSEAPLEVSIEIFGTTAPETSQPARPSEQRG